MLGVVWRGLPPLSLLSPTSFSVVDHHCDVGGGVQGVAPSKPPLTHQLQCGRPLGGAILRRATMQSQEVVVRQSGPGLLIRALYFILFGWWFSGIWAVIAWVLCLTIIGLPLGLYMLNR